MKTLAIFAILGVSLALYLAYQNDTPSKIEGEFRSFLEEYKVGYGSNQEYEYRLRIFEENMKKAEDLNKANPYATFGVTVFADQTSEEMEKRMGFIKPEIIESEEVPYERPPNARSVSWEHLWRAQIKNQGNCGSCWAFSVTSAFEGRYALARGKQSVDTFFSEQQLVDCCTQSSGCNGGYLDSTFQYLQGNPFCSGGQYPYRAVKGGCNHGICRGGPSARGRYIYPYRNEGAVLEGLMGGPISVCLDATQWGSYRGGIVTSCGGNMNHCVTAIASNFEHSVPHIRFRNSWGAGWGENGNINLKIGQNMCRYADYGEIPIF